MPAVALTRLQWKPFKFFDVSQVKLPDAESVSLFEVPDPPPAPDSPALTKP